MKHHPERSRILPAASELLIPQERCLAPEAAWALHTALFLANQLCE